MEQKKKLSDLKTMPHSEEAEMAVLAGVLGNNKFIDKVSEIISEEDFYYLRNQQIFKIMKELYSDSHTIDMITVKSKAAARNVNIDVAYLVKIGDYFSYSGIESHCKIIKEKALLRAIITSSHKTIQDAYDEPTNIDDFVQSIERSFFQISQRKVAENESVLAKNLITDMIDRMGELRKNPGHVSGLETGLKDLDVMTTGFHNQDYVILAGRPSSGKTSLALNFAYHVASHQKLPVLFFSLEMSKEQIMERLFCLAAKADHHLMRQGRGSGEEWARMTSKIREISELPFLINDGAAISLNFLRSKIRRAKIDYPNLAFVIIDYIQLMSYPEADNREQQVSTISKGIKALCKEINIPILALSQMNRMSEMRGDPTPRLSDLRESGTLEQDSDLVFFIWQKEGEGEGYGKPVPAKLKIGKQRNGPVGTIDVMFFRESMRFENKF